MPLTLAAVGEESMIQRVGGKQEVRAHLENLGFVSGGMVTVISTIGGNLIVNVKESRVAISKEMAGKILVKTGTDRPV
ncbi:MAG: ferrous iron transport protein A [Lachnospiraceae bacterium]|jgi:ferrous iron transport protein A|nr:ferrous iron transport protein A [Lachnospiraceae bacterium]